MAGKKRHKPKQETCIRDARGRKVTQLDPVDMRLLRRHDTIDGETLRLMADEIGSGLDSSSRKLMRAFLILGALMAIVLMIQFIDFSIQGNPLDVFSLPNITVVNFLFWPMLVWLRARQLRFGKIRKVMLRYQHCPHCGYDISNLVADPNDGATICPECGCAWMLVTPSGKFVETPLAEGNRLTG